MTRKTNANGTFSMVSNGTVTKNYTKTHKLKLLSSPSATRAYAYNANDSLVGESLLMDGLTSATGYGYKANEQA